MNGATLIALPLLDPSIVHAAAAGLALVMLTAALDKLREPEIFRDAVENYALLPAPLVPLVARGLPLLEGAAGALLLPGATRVLGALLALALLALVTGAAAINLRRGRARIDCGCGGDQHMPLSPALLLRNAVLMGVALLAAAPATARDMVWLDGIAIAFAALFLFGLFALTNALLRHHSRLIDLRNSR